MANRGGRAPLECRVPRNRMKPSRPALVLLGALISAAAFPASAQEVKGRVVVLGFDGADHRLVSQFLAEGKLPNLAKLAQQGSFSPLRPTIPAQTPVSWSTFSTGLSPGRTQIFDFLKRDPKTYRPEFAIATEGKKDFLLGRGNRAGAAAAGALLGFLLVFALGRFTLKKTIPAAALALVLAAPAGFFSWRFGGLLPESLQTVRNNRKGTPFWEVAGAKGIKSVVLHVPVTFPAADYDEGRLLSGLGVPDVRGRIGTPSYYTSDPFFSPGNKNEFSVELIRLESNVGTIQTEVFGPYNKLFGEPPVIKIPMTLTVLPDGGRLRIEPKGSEPVTLKPGEWSPWVTFTFEFNPVVKLSGHRTLPPRGDRPGNPALPLARQLQPGEAPPGREDHRSREPREGPCEAVRPLQDDGVVDRHLVDERGDDRRTDVPRRRHAHRPAVPEDDGRAPRREGREALRPGLRVHRPGRARHVALPRPGAPRLRRGEGGEIRPSVERNYVQMDDIVGDALKELGPDDLLLVCSDHGFTSWRRSINYNTWLVQHGFLALKGGDEKQADLEMLFGQGEFWPNVDWSRTKAYSMGLGEIYVNVRGREAQGIVEPGAEYDDAAPGDPDEADVPRRRGDRAQPRRTGLHARGGLRLLRPGPHPRHLRHEQRGLPGLAGRRASAS